MQNRIRKLKLRDTSFGPLCSGGVVARATYDFENVSIFTQ